MSYEIFTTIKIMNNLYHLQKFLCAFCNPSLFPHHSHPQATTDMLFVTIDLFAFWEIYMESYCMCTLSPSGNYFEWHPCCCFFSTVHSFFITEQYFIAWICHSCLSVHLLIEHLSCFSFLTITICLDIYVQVFVQTAYFFLLGEYVGMKWLGHIVDVYLTYCFPYIFSFLFWGSPSPLDKF